MITLLTVINTEATRQVSPSHRMELATLSDGQASFAGGFARLLGNMIQFVSFSWLIRSRLRNFQSLPAADTGICEAR